MHKVAEVGIMTAGGGGTSAYFGALRGRGVPISSGGESTGSVHFMELYNKLMNVVSQGNVRRGSFAAYLPIDHPDIEEFLKIRSEGNEIQDLSFGVCVSDSWMKKMIAEWYSLFEQEKVIPMRHSSWENPFACCGATYAKIPKSGKPGTTDFGRGIRIIECIHGKERDTYASQLKHVSTRNGDLTIIVRKIRDAS